MDLLSGAFGIHERALGVRSQRLEVLSRNIANADTPNYKAEELDFKAMLKDLQTQLRVFGDAPLGPTAYLLENRSPDHGHGAMLNKN